MNLCARAEEIEDLHLGNLEPRALARARAHLAACEVCQQAAACFAAERSLFERRASFADELPPPLDPALFDAAPDVEAPRRTLSRLVPAVLAIAACVGAYVNVGRSHGVVGDVDCPAPAGRGEASSLATGDLTSTQSRLHQPLASFVMGLDEPLACAQAMGGALVKQAANEGQACVSIDRATCEDPMAMSQ